MKFMYECRLFNYYGCFFLNYYYFLKSAISAWELDMPQNKSREADGNDAVNRPNAEWLKNKRERKRQLCSP